MTDDKKISGKLTEQQLEMGLELLEKRAAVERKAPPRKKTGAQMKEAAAKALQKALPAAPPPDRPRPLRTARLPLRRRSCARWRRKAHAKCQAVPPQGQSFLTRSTAATTRLSAISFGRHPLHRSERPR